MSAVDWTRQQKEVFLRMQFEAQSTYYRRQFPSMQYDVVVLDDLPIGRLIVNRDNGEIRLMDITFLPEYRGRGLGTMLTAELIDEARRTGKTVRLHVEKFNRALRLYQRLGFQAREDQGIYLMMEWTV